MLFLCFHPDYLKAVESVLSLCTQWMRSFCLERVTKSPCQDTRDSDWLFSIQAYVAASWLRLCEFFRCRLDRKDSASLWRAYLVHLVGLTQSRVGKLCGNAKSECWKMFAWLSWIIHLVSAVWSSRWDLLPRTLTALQQRCPRACLLW